MANIARSGTLTVSGSFDGVVSTFGVNSTNAAIHSDATFATTTGMALKDGNNLFVTAGSNAAGQLVLSTITSSWLPVAVNLSYDANGNLLGDGQKNYAYDDFNHLSSVWVAGQWKSDFVYDALRRRRIARDYAWRGSWQLTNETRYVCDGLLPIRELNSNNLVQVTYTRGLDLSGRFGGAGGIGGLLARTDGSGSAYYHADLGGNITSLTDAGGNVVARYLYDPFGGLLGKWGSLADANRYRFSSKELHPASGMYYYGYRFFDSNLQRWLNRDPMGEVGGQALYRFVGNNPLGGVDLYGLSEEATGGLLGSLLQNALHELVQGAKDLYRLLNEEPAPPSMPPFPYWRWQDVPVDQLPPSCQLSEPSTDTLMLMGLGMMAPEVMGLRSGSSSKPCPKPTYFHYSTNPNLEGKGLTLGSGVTTVGDFNAQQAMFNLGIDPPKYVYPVTLDNPADFLIRDVGIPARSQVPAFETIKQTPPVSIGPATPVPRGR